jgi:hypothetical protein
VKKVCFTIFLLLILLQPDISSSNGVNGLKIVCNNWPDTSTLKDFGESSIKILQAKSNEERAIAIWRSNQHLTVATSVIPKERALGIDYVVDPLKLLNVYGGHWCDGLSRVMEMTWRSLGYRAQKLYKFGHTFADCHWKDNDGIERWHVFDVSQHCYVYDRSGGHITTKDELALDHSLIYFPSRTPIPSDPSLMVPSYVHGGHLRIEPHSTSINLRIGESMERAWGNEDKPYYNLFGKEKKKDIKHGPYPVTYGNGRMVYEPDLSKRTYKQGLFQKTVNVSCTEEDGLKPALHPSKISEKGVAIFKVSLPYIVSDAWVKASIVRENLKDEIRFSFSVDDGQTWRTFWEAGDKIGAFNLNDLDFCESFDPDQKSQPKIITPFGRYEYLVKIEMKAAEKITSCGIESLSLVTVFQHNLFSLPMLWPGPNIITLRGDLDPNSMLRVTYAWDDVQGTERIQTVTIKTLPFQYEILTKGEKWEDVICRSLKIETLMKDEKKEIGSLPNKHLSAHAPSSSSHQPASSNDYPATSNQKLATRNQNPSSIPLFSIYPTDKLVGNYHPPALKEAPYYIKQIENGKEIGQALLALGALRDPKAKDILERVIAQDRTHPFQNKVWACQALFQSVGRSGAPMMVRVLERDKSIAWHDPQNKWSQDAMWLHTAGMAAAILASIKTFDRRERAADIIAETLTGKRTVTDPRGIWRGEEICWGLIKSLGKLGSKKHVPLLKIYLKEDSDARTMAIQALGDIGDPSVVPDLLSILRNFKYSPNGLSSIEVLGKIGTKAIGPELYPFLSHWDEDFRGAAAIALGKIGDPNSIPKLEEMVEKENFSWVITAAKESLRVLEGN